MDFNELKNVLKEKTQERIDFRRDFSDEEVSDIINEVMLESEEVPLLKMQDRRRLHKEIFDSLRRLDILQSFVDDPSVTERSTKQGILE